VQWPSSSVSPQNATVGIYPPFPCQNPNSSGEGIRTNQVSFSRWLEDKGNQPPYPPLWRTHPRELPTPVKKSFEMLGVTPVLLSHEP